MFTNEYGFIVDYLAEVLRELRKEDYTNAYKEFFELSDTLTTRDRDAIAKTFSGLVKIIYPNKEYTQKQAKELFDFAVEVRKRVKQQLIKMDDTFEEVDFSYIEKPKNKKQSIQTLEYLTYLGEGENSKSEAKGDHSKKEEEKGETDEPPQRKTHQKTIFENQTGISYRKLFGKYLKGATEIEIEDPYIRYHYQFRNFMEFCSMLADIKSEGEEIKLTLKTSNEKEHIDDAAKAFEEIKDSLESLGIFLDYQFKEKAHDRFIVADTGWKILIGRGLDIFQKSESAYDLAGIHQEKRKCKQTEITYLPNN
jgi:ATP-dependent Lon protease